MFGQLLLQTINIFIAGDLLPPKPIIFNPFRLNVLLPEQFLGYATPKTLALAPQLLILATRGGAGKKNHIFRVQGKNEL